MPHGFLWEQYTGAMRDAENPDNPGWARALLGALAVVAAPVAGAEEYLGHGALTPRWRSSLAVFEYQPPPELQREDGSIVSYLKVACTITGFQADGREIQMRDRLGRSGWATSDMTKRLGEMAAEYYPCMGAILEVVVAPQELDRRFTLKDYPYFADFDPKKREMYEVVTETGETMSRSLEDVNVRHGQTTLQSHEVRDTTTLSASLSAEYAGVKASGTVTNESGTTDLTQQGTENVRTVDGAREARETFSHTTQLSQMYHQLDSYHLGSNRAAFFILPRPHTIQTPATFVNGPREIEGVQEFMLVVMRPKEMENFCVEAYLETAHLTGTPIYNWGGTTVDLPLRVDTPDDVRHYDSATTVKQPGMVVDRNVNAFVDPGAPPHGDVGGYLVNSFYRTFNGGYDFVVNVDTVTVNGWAEGLHNRHPDEMYGSTMNLDATVFLKRAVPVIDGYGPGLMITARAVCSCDPLIIEKVNNRPSIVYEKALMTMEELIVPKHQSMSIRDANRLGSQLKRELLQSLSSADRYPRGTVDLLDSQLFAGMMGVQIRHADGQTNPLIMDHPSINENLKRRIGAIAPSVTRSDLLEMPLPEQVDRFGLTFEEAVQLRRDLADLAAPDGPRPIPKHATAEVPLLTGLRSHEAMAALSAVGLRYGTATTVDNSLPAGTVIEQEPQAGTQAEAGSDVSVRLASGLSVRVPDIRRMGLSEAGCMLRRAGLRSEPTVEGRPTPETEVVGQDPPAGTLVTPNSPISITLIGRSKSSR